jgi:outer membrane protein assembly factor BamE (lipoprotein component of BamABCDE complex)
MITRLALPSCLLLLAGCFVLYVPDPSRADTRGSIENQDLKPFMLGVTTREEVLLTLGEPDLESEDGTVFMYWWYYSRGFLLVAWGVVGPAGGASGGGNAGMMGMRINLCIKFDEAGKVVRHKFVHGLDEAQPLQIQKVLARW